MKKVFLSLIVFVAFWNSSLSGQNGNSGSNGNAVISEIQVYDLGDRTGLIEVRVSGNLASTVTGGNFAVINPDDIRQNVTGSLLRTRVVGQPGNDEVILEGNFPLVPSSENGPSFVALEIQVQAAGFIITKSKEKDNFKIFRYR